MHVNNYDNLPFTAVSHKLTYQPNNTDIQANIIKEGDTTPKMIPPYEEIKSVTNTNTINTEHTTSNITRNEGHMTTPMDYDEQPHEDVNDETTLQSHRTTTNDYEEQRNEDGGDETTNMITAKTIQKIPTHLHASFQVLN